MIAHEAKGMHLPMGLLACLCKRAQETLPILVIFEDGLPAIPTIHHVIHCPGILDAQLARHAGRLLLARYLCQEDLPFAGKSPEAPCANRPPSIKPKISEV